MQETFSTVDLFQAQFLRGLHSQLKHSCHSQAPKSVLQNTLFYIWYHHVLSFSVTKDVENAIDTTIRLYEKYFPAVSRVAMLQYNCLMAHFCQGGHSIMGIILFLQDMIIG